MPPSCALLGGFAIGVATLWKCVAEPSGNPPGPPHACRTRTLRMPATTSLAISPSAAIVTSVSYSTDDRDPVVTAKHRNIEVFLFLVTQRLTYKGPPNPCPS